MANSPVTAVPPTTYDETIGGNLADQIDRYRDLDGREAMARSIAILKGRGTYQPSEHVNEEKFPPLTVAEHLEMLALGERTAAATGTRRNSTKLSRPGPPGSKSPPPPAPPRKPPGPPMLSGLKASTSMRAWTTPGMPRRSSWPGPETGRPA